MSEPFPLATVASARKGRSLVRLRNGRGHIQGDFLNESKCTVARKLMEYKGYDVEDTR